MFTICHDRFFLSIHLAIAMLLLRGWFLVSETSHAAKQSRLHSAGLGVFA
jgi:hypothetical protein